VQIGLRAGGEPAASQYLSGTIGYPDEFLLRPTDEELLRKVARETGGVFDPKPQDVFASVRATAAAEQELWPWLIGLAVALFIADVAVRRLHFS
jgi:hypothetical protein